MTRNQPVSRNKLTNKTAAKLFGLTLLSAAITLLFSFLGAPLLRVIRSAGGKTWFWTSGTILTLTFLGFGLNFVAALLFGIWASIGVYAEFEDRGRAGFSAAFWSVFLGTAASLLIIQGYSLFAGISWHDNLKLSFSSLLNAMQEQSTQKEASLSWLREIQSQSDDIIGQVPSILAVVILSSLAFALILDRRTAEMTGLRFERAASGIRLLEFKLPDGFIWVALLSFLFSFLKIGIPWVSLFALNLFNVMIAAYFFQGLAVIETAFLVFRLGVWVRAFIYIFIIGQLFFLVSLVGIIDFWANFRGRLRGVSSSGSDSQKENRKEKGV